MYRHEHGGNIYKVADDFGIAEDKLIDFSASINPLGISDRVKNVIKQELDRLVHYPDPDTKILREKLAGHHAIDYDSIICGNGSTELIYLIPRALKPRTTLILAPTFSEYERAVRVQMTESGTQIKELVLREDHGFSVNVEEFIYAMAGCEMAFLCNPNNPTGNILKREDVLRIAEAAKKQDCVLVVDEAFIDYQLQESVIRDVKNNPFLVVLRSMTKFYAITGLRAGYAVFHHELIGNIKKFKEPWTVNTLAQKAAVTALEDLEYIDKTIETMKQEKAYMEKCFREAGLTYFPSAANYFMLKISDASSLVSELRQRGILVRDCSNFKGLNEEYIRVAVKSREHNQMLMKEIKDCRA